MGPLQVERIDLGEDVDYDYVSSAIDAGVELWNECVDKVKQKFENPETILEGMKQLSGPEVTHEQLNMALENAQEHAMSLQKINLKAEHGMFLKLGHMYINQGDSRVVVVFFHGLTRQVSQKFAVHPDTYIYIYI